MCVVIEECFAHVLLNELFNQIRRVMRKLLCLIIAASSMLWNAQAQEPTSSPSPSVPDGYWLEVVAYAVHDGMVGNNRFDRVYNLSDLPQYGK